ncbi:Lipoprotein signal peptidase [Candidatus Westeberhardia cardiocondylae]|uniref:Lipoprotein signal peptidase n=1 Tax=Candidatus Westeberhardia cardiocondylae TaxID=1594731 RepID=A0A0H5BX63_9ENTR|nr:lipoprotein signal peptidase [Candidatus Westeberhardia cardiocondylae]CEN32342.1 Lipoprotein signal peptidase [Candidatus Westeberhardia cardiocondylae]
MIDIFSKLIILLYLLPGESIEIIPKYLNFTHIYNPGIIFGIYSNQKKYCYIFSIILSVTMLIILTIKVYKKNKKNSIIYSIIIGGILGNLLNRILLYGIIDFIDFYIYNYHFPIFNFADISIIIGIGLIIFKFNNTKIT